MPEAFIPYTVTGRFERGIMARTHGDPAALIDRVKQEVGCRSRRRDYADRFADRISHAVLTRLPGSASCSWVSLRLWVWCSWRSASTGA